MRETEHASLRIFDVFTEENSSRILLQTGSQGFVHRIADAIFPGRQDFFLDLWRRFGDVSEKLVRRRILGFFAFAVFATNALLNFAVEFGEFLCANDAFLDEPILPTFKGIEFFELPQFFLAAIQFLIVRTGVAGEPLHLDPEEEWPVAGANLVERFRGSVVKLLHVLSVDPTPVVRLENVQRERIGLARGHADAVSVVFDEKEQRKFFLPGETNRFEKISLASCGIADRGYDEIFFAV